jgi:murein DD-endopeptidase MepM/ murein hydrolase activator NlpD
MHLPIKQSYIIIRGKDVKNSFGWGGRKNDDGSPKPHQGWDIAASIGTPVCAIADGKIKYIKNRHKILNAEGKWVEAPYGNEICLDKAGQAVNRQLRQLSKHRARLENEAGKFFVDFKLSF